MPPKAKAKAAAGAAAPEPIRHGMDKSARGSDSLGTRMASKSGSSEEEAEQKAAVLTKKLEESQKRSAELEVALEEKEEATRTVRHELDDLKAEGEGRREVLEDLAKQVGDNMKRLHSLGGVEIPAGLAEGEEELSRDERTVKKLVHSVQGVLQMAKEAASPSRKAALQQSLQSEIKELKANLDEERKAHSAKMDERERQIAKLSALVGDLQRQNRDVIGTSSEGVRGARVENQKLREELQEVQKERDMLDLWNAENMRILTRQEEQLANQKKTEVLLREQDARFQNESNRLVKSWNAKKQEYEHSMKNITSLETQVEKLREECAKKDMLILDLRKASRAKDIEQYQKQVKRLVAENQDKTIKIRDLELKLKKLSAQFDLSSQQKSDGMGLSLDAVAQLLTQTTELVSPSKSRSKTSPSKPLAKSATGSVADVQVAVMREKLNDKDKEISALNSNIKSYIAKDMDLKTKLRDQGEVKRKYETMVDQYRYEQNLVNSRWERKVTDLESENTLLRHDLTKSQHGGLLGHSPGSGADHRTPSRGGAAGGGNMGSTILRPGSPPDFDFSGFDLSPASDKDDDAPSVTKELEETRKSGEALLKVDTQNKPHWTAAIFDNGRPKSAFTGRTLAGSLVTSQTSSAVNVGGLAGIARPGTASASTGSRSRPGR
ncbi:unnamed protein product [Amoebophrya sp. A120]|nr:unnamed protein product [Amoebophrya sp. A120]|eukprot:GSA120T00018450001.1